MKNAIPRYSFYKTKYGSELLIDVVDLQYTRKFLPQGKVHILTYYDITFITEGEGEFTIGNRTHLAAPGDVFFSKPGEVRSWDTDRDLFLQRPTIRAAPPVLPNGKNRRQTPTAERALCTNTPTSARHKGRNRLFPPTRYGHIARLTLRGPHATQPCLPHLYPSGDG